MAGAEQVESGAATAAGAPNGKRERTQETEDTQAKFGPGGKTQRTQYERKLPGSRPIACAQGRVDRTGATAATQAGRTRVLCREQVSRRTEEENRER